MSSLLNIEEIPCVDGGVLVPAGKSCAQWWEFLWNWGVE